MAVNPVSATNAALNANSIGIEEFLKILSSQLNNQDPLKPLDNQEFLSQIAQFSALQQSQVLNQRMEQLLLTQAASQSVGLIGKDVSYKETFVVDGVRTEETFTGRVTGVKMDDGAAQLVVNVNIGPSTQTRTISYSQLVTIP